MSAFAVIFATPGTTVQPPELERVMARLGHRGPDGRDIHLAANLALGHWHFQTTPEEAGERQPLTLEGMPFTIVLDGRLDNREELCRELGIEAAQGKVLSDASLLIHAYARWGGSCPEHLLGDFAFVLHDPLQEALFCARDALGERTLFYARQGNRWIIASEPWAVAAALPGKGQIDEITVAHYFAVRPAPDGRTFFEGIRELLPATAMHIPATGEARTWQYWKPDFSQRRRGLSDGEYAAEFLALLKESLRCRLRAREPLGILMSGGLDSTSLTCLGAQMLPPGGLTAYSFVYDELTDCDERNFMNMVVERYALPAVQMPCDDAWPFQDDNGETDDPNRPDFYPYPLMKARGYERAREDGRRILLGGGFGDNLYTADVDWWLDLVADRGIIQGMRELDLIRKHVGLGATVRAVQLRCIARRLMSDMLKVDEVHLGRRTPPWLTEPAARLVRGAKASGIPARWQTLLGKANADSSTREIYHANRHGLELRHPYRDRRLVEFMLSLPAYQSYFRGRYKYILRNAMQGILPEPLRCRGLPTAVTALYNRGFDRERERLEAFFSQPQARWRKYIRADWLGQHLQKPLTPQSDGPQALVPNLCLAYEKWLKWT